MLFPLRVNLFVVSMSLLVLSCQTRTISEQTLDLSYLTAKAPNTWSLIKLQGADSNIQGILTDKGDTLFLDYGPYSWSFDDVQVPVRSLEQKRVFDSTNFHYSKHTVFSKVPEIDEAQAIHLKEYFLYDTINGKRAKIILPKLIGQGRIGIHFSDIEQKGIKLTIYGHDLDTLQQFAVYKLFQSIRFRKNL